MKNPLSFLWPRVARPGRRAWPTHNFFVSVMVCLLLGMSYRLQSQIACTPTFEIHSGNDTLDLDLNHDGLTDVSLLSFSFGGFFEFVNFSHTTYSQNSVLRTVNSDALPLVLNDSIAASTNTWALANWGTTYLAMVTSGTATGAWAGLNDHYVGLRFEIDSGFHYGWARFSVSASSNAYTLTGYAYNTVPDQGLRAGEGCGSPGNPAFYVPAQSCYNAVYPLFASAGLGSSSTFTWSVAPATASFSSLNGAATAVQFLTGGTYTISLAATTGSVSGTAFQTVVVSTVMPLVSVSPSAAIQCPSATTVQALGTGSSYLWEPQPEICGRSGSTATLCPWSTPLTYTVTAALGGCRSQTTVVCSTESFTIMTGAFGQNSLCEKPINGSPVSKAFSASVIGASTYSIQVLVPPQLNVFVTSGGYILSSAPPYINNAGLIQYTISVYRAGCDYAHNIMPSISVIPNPTFSWLPSNVSACAGQETELSGSGTIWDRGSTDPGSILVVGGSKLKALPVSDTKYWAHTRTAGMCRSAVDTVYVTVRPSPSPFTIVGNTKVCVGETAYLRAQGPDDYTWTGGTSGIDSVQVSSAVSGNVMYTVTAANNYSCTRTATAQVQVLDCTGFDEQHSDFFSVAPNPVQEVLRVKFAGTAPAKLCITGAGGAVVGEGWCEPGKVNEVSFDAFPAGLYFLRLTSAENSWNARIIK